MKKYTRRGALALIAGGTAVLVVGSDGNPNTEAERITNINVSSDSSAYLAINELQEGKTYDEPHDVTLTNNLGKDFDGSNTVFTVAGDLELRESPSDTPSQTLNPGNLNDGDSYSFEIVLATGKNGDVTDDVVVDLNASDGSSVRVDRTITVNQKSSGRLVYGLSNDLRVYNAIQDNENDPPDTNDVQVIGANAADVIGDGNVDIPFADSNGMFVTSVGATSETQVFLESNKSFSIKTSKTRLSVGEWPPSSLSGKLILFADQSSNIRASDGNGNTDQIASPSNGVGGVSGVGDIDGDGNVEMVFVDGSQQLRYLEQSGSIQAISNGGIGSNNSAGFGPPADFTGNGTLRIPFIDGSQNPALVDANGNKETLNSSGIARKAAVAPVDIDGDGVLEFMFLGNSSGKIRWLDDVSGSNTQEGPLTVGGTQIVPDEKLGLNSGVNV